MARYSSRRLEVFSLHARHKDEQVDYKALFSAIAKMKPRERAFDYEEKLVAIPTIEIAENVAKVIAYEGEKGLNPLIYNIARGTSRVQQLDAIEMLATKTHCIIDIAKREAVVEYNHKGAKAGDIARAIESAGRAASPYYALTVSLNPVVDRGFIPAINRFEKIKIVTVSLSRPNQDWTDDAEYFLKTAEDSDAHSVSVSMHAERGESLAKNSGIVRFIKRMTNSARSFLKSASVVGTEEGEEGNKTVSLTNHVEHHRVNVRMTDDGHVDDEDIERRIQTYLYGRTKGE